MSAWLWASGLMMGLAGGPHCLAMCGAACSAVSMRCGGARAQQALAAWQAGRFLSYAVAGALVASSVSLLGEWGRELAWLRPWWVMLHLAALALGLWMLWQGRAPQWMSASVRLPAWASGEAAAAAPGPGGGLLLASAGAGPLHGGASGDAVPSAGPRPVLWLRAGGAGAAWVALPCGLLQSALVVAALGSSAAEGALVMAAFAVGSGISLWFGPRLWTWLARAGRGRADGWLGPVQAVRLAGALLAIGSGWAVAHHVLMPWWTAFCA